MKKLISFVLAVVLVVGLSSAAIAWSGRGSRTAAPAEERYNNSSGPAGCRFELSEYEDEKLTEIREEYWQEREKLELQLEEKQIEFDELYYDSNSSKTEIESLQDEINELRRRILALRDEFRLELRENLTDEELEEIGYNEGNERTGFRSGKRGHRGPGRGF
ncbi:MAG: periplasmic heavy metal sensor [bacterium]